MKLFHGSYMKIEYPEIIKGRTKVDFGQGFYLTGIKLQAEKWSKVIAIRKGPAFRPVVNMFELNEDIFDQPDFRIKRFKEYDLEWLQYVVDCRRGGNLQKQYDLIEGGVANDNVIDTVEDFENGRITAEQALGQLVYKQVNHQICIRNQQIIDKYLQFVSSYQILEIMRDSVLWRKQSRIVMLLAKEKNITPEQALDIYYSSRTAQLLSDPNTGLQLMSDQYVLEDLLKELEEGDVSAASEIS